MSSPSTRRRQKLPQRARFVGCFLGDDGRVVFGLHGFDGELVADVVIPEKALPSLIATLQSMQAALTLLEDCRGSA